MSCCSNAQWKHQVSNGALEGLARRERPRASGAKAEANGSSGPDVIYYNGTFHLATPNPQYPTETVTAVAVTGKTITDVGDQTRILGEATGSTQKVNLNGQTMVPGFVEAHAHIIAAVQTVYCTALTAASYPTITAVLQKIQGDINAAPAKSWLFYMSFDPSLLPWDENGAGTGFPQLGFDEFNTLSNPNNVCVWVENASGHIAYANQQAFTAAGVTTNTQPGDGGWFGTYTSGPNEGQLNGIMFEPPTFGYFTKFAPTLTTDQVEDAMLGFLKTAQAAGITTVCDPAVGIGGNIAQELELYEL
ncbi:MAG: amidohydrolase family protein, partial [Candidatus Eremiobacteraeota bacterium]|nr:amidohydrolase family protein [Candidatus Eremiobacteraeota bacterium]